MAPPTGPPFTSPSPQPLPYPALYLYPLNDSFVPKHIALNHGQHVKIGRQTNAKTAPGERNGYFDSKVLSRQHAEVWEEGGKIYIKDVKSSNGTFINGERLSSEAVESDPYELKSDDIVEFGIDIVGDDNKTIIHHKVAARVNCIFTEQDAQVAARAEAHQQAQAAAAAAAAQQQQQQQQSQQQPSPSSQQQQQNGVGGGYAGGTLNGAPNGFNFAGSAAGTPGVSSGSGTVVNGGVITSAGMGGVRRAPMNQPTLGGMGGMGGGMRPPGKSGLTFDVILSRLQGELQKSRETGAELGSLTGVLGDVGEVLGGGLPPNLPSYPSILPPIRPSIQEPPAPPPAAPVPPPTNANASSSASPPVSGTGLPPLDSGIAELQAQLKETQESLREQVEKIRVLEDAASKSSTGDSTKEKGEDEQDAVKRLLEEQEEMKREVGRLRRLVEERRRALSASEEEEGGFVAHHLESVAEEDESAPQDQEEEEDGDDDDDDDDARSVVTVTPGSDEQEQDEREEGEKERKERGEEVEKDRPRTPEPSSALDAAGTIRGPARKTRGAIIASRKNANEDVQAQISRLSEQVVAISQMSKKLEGLEKMESVQEWTRRVERFEQMDGKLAGVDAKLASLSTVEEKMGSFNAVEEKLESFADISTKLDSLTALSANMDSLTTLSANMSSLATISANINSLAAISTKLDSLASLASKLESVVQLTSTLEAQHAEAQSTIKGLEGKVEVLEGLLKEREVVGKDTAEKNVDKATTPKVDEKDKESLTERISEWMKSVDGKWASVQSEWSAERERLRGAREEWESKVKQVDSGLQSIASLQAETRRMNASFGGHSLANGGIYVNGDVVKHNGLVTPPSPRSQSSDSGSGRYRRRRRRGRSARSESVSGSSEESESEDEGLPSTSASSSTSKGASTKENKGRKTKKRTGGARVESPTRRVEEDVDGEGEDDLHSEATSSLGGSMMSRRGKGSAIITSHISSMPTPAASVADADSNPPETRRSSFGTTDTQSSPSNDHQDPSAATSRGDSKSVTTFSRPNNVQVQTAVGVLLLSVAAAAVIWKVRPDGR